MERTSLSRGSLSRKAHAGKFNSSTGGYAFSPKSMGSTVAICELETVLCLEDRPPFTLRPLAMSSQMYIPESVELILSFNFILAQSVIFHSRVSLFQIDDVVDQTICPPVRDHPNLSDTFLALREASEAATESRRNTRRTQRYDTRDGVPRLMSEVSRIYVKR